jgi:hypothetical protein
MDLRELIAAMTADDKKLFDECRTGMRRAYLIAHAKTMKAINWEIEDDAFMDMIDIKLATLFDRDGRIEATKTIVSEKDAEQTVKDLHSKDDLIKDKLKVVTQSGLGLPAVQWGKNN